MTEAGHNSEPVVAERLRSIVERHERLEGEVSALRSDQKDILQEAVSGGFDKKVIRQLLRIRKMDPEDAANEESLLDLYKSALGMG